MKDKQVEDYASNLKGEVDNFNRYRDIYLNVHTLLRGGEPFNIQIRRSFNRSKLGAASTVALCIANELSPDYPVTP